MSSQEMVDIAVSSTGEMFGVSWDPAATGGNHLYRITPPTTVGSGVAAARRIGQLGYFYNALSFAPAGTVDATAEVLVGLDNESTYSQSYLDVLSTTTAASSFVGGLGNSLKSSGDIVGIAGLGLYATVKDSVNGTNFLASINPANGVATTVGTGIGHNDMWGLAYDSGQFIAFSLDGWVMQLDPSTGTGPAVWDYDVAFYGAGMAP